MSDTTERHDWGFVSFLDYTGNSDEYLDHLREIDENTPVDVACETGVHKKPIGTLAPEGDVWALEGDHRKEYRKCRSWHEAMAYWEAHPELQLKA